MTKELKAAFERLDAESKKPYLENAEAKMLEFNQACKKMV